MTRTRVFMIAVAVLLCVGVVSCEKDTNNNNATTTNNGGGSNPGGGDNPGGGGDNPGGGGNPVNVPDVQGFDANGASYALFSVSPTTQVRFSRGNLQYQASTDTWRFAEHQFDYVGEGNANISPTYDGWIDLFGWGTSGWNSGMVCYLPWSTSKEHTDFTLGEGDTNSLEGPYANADWGVYNAISNGGNQPGMWRTLTFDEWYYLLNERADAATKCGNASIGEVRGLVILPDNWSTPEGIVFTPGFGEYHTNEYSYAEWSRMEGAGAVFLPPAGYRTGTDVYDVESRGSYWTASCVWRNYQTSYDIDFDGNSCRDVNWSKRYYGNSVRLVRN